jgi:nitroreductase
MDVWTAVSTKRVIREFADRPIEEDRLVRLVDAGRRAGSSKNRQAWDFVVCRDRAHLAELSGVGPYAGHLAGAAVGIALITPDPAMADAPLSVMWDLGQAAENMMLVAWEMGIGSVPATVYDHDLARRLLGYPADRHCEFLLSLGYPADPARLTAPRRAGKRKSFDEVVHWERW